MKIREIIVEDNNTTKFGSNLLPVLSFLYYRSKNKGLTPKIHTASLIQFVQNAGDSTFDYDTLCTLNQTDEAVNQILSQFELVGEDGEPETFGDGGTIELDEPQDEFPPDEMGMDEMPPDDMDPDGMGPDDMDQPDNAPPGNAPAPNFNPGEPLEPHETPPARDIVSGMANRRSRSSIR